MDDHLKQELRSKGYWGRTKYCNAAEATPAAAAAADAAARAVVGAVDARGRAARQNSGSSESGRRPRRPCTCSVIRPGAQPSSPREFCRCGVMERRSPTVRHSIPACAAVGPARSAAARTAPRHQAANAGCHVP